MERYRNGAVTAPILLLPLIYYKRNATGADRRHSFIAPMCLIAKTTAGYLEHRSYTIALPLKSILKALVFSPGRHQQVSTAAGSNPPLLLHQVSGHGHDRHPAPHGVIVRRIG